jgi:hypothetical protein
MEFLVLFAFHLICITHDMMLQHRLANRWGSLSGCIHDGPIVGDVKKSTLTARPDDSKFYRRNNRVGEFTNVSVFNPLDMQRQY